MPAQLYMGRHPEKALDDTVDLWPHKPTIPHEDTADGCPGGWYRTAFASSVLRYSRRRTEHGGRVDNGLLRDTPPQIWEAVLEFELEQERSHAHATREARRIAERNRPKTKKGGRNRGHRR